MSLCSIIYSIKRFDIYRIRNWFYYIGFVVLGTTISSGIKDVNPLVLLVSAFVLAFMFSINDFADNEIKKKYFVYPLILFILTCYLLNLYQFILILFVLFISIIYSVKPFRFKGVPVLGTLCCTVALPQFFLIGYLEKTELNLRAYSIFLFLVLLSVLLQIIHEVNHIKLDAVKSTKTSAVFFGKENMEKVCIVILVFIFILAFLLYFKEWINLITVVAVFIFCIFNLVNMIVFGIQYHTWRNFRILALFSGVIWFLSCTV